MIGTDVVVAGCVLSLAVLVGLLGHEAAHVAVLRFAGIDYEIAYFPGRRRRSDVVGALASVPWAMVEPRVTGRESPTVLRLAALAPMFLGLPIVVLGLVGAVPTDRPIMTAAMIGWLGCTIPSPRDFSVVFYAHRALEEPTDENAAVRVSRAD
ncbi:hypothetical protein ACFQGT_10810 [Natrialbaceae archaeon GCM10025810]|uniref:hypothetical protein n=1 Tax=Halovalidus salilacus TaxID=3075124 RepID=UPI003611A0F1